MIYYGMDVHDRKSNYYAIDQDGLEVGTASFYTTQEAFTQHFGDLKPSKIVIEAGAHSHWIGKLLESFGHRVVVAHPTRVRLIAKSQEKDDRVDAEFLARLLRADLKLLSPTYLRSETNLFFRGYLKVRGTYVKARTMLINTGRGLVKSFGIKLPQCVTEQFVEKVEGLTLPEEVKGLLIPLLAQIRHFSTQIEHFDREIEEMAQDSALLRRFQEVPGVGPLVALAFMLHIGDPTRFSKGTAVGRYFGLTSGRRMSGEGGYQTRITKAGDPQMRTLMIQAAYGVMRTKKESDLKNWANQLLRRMGEARSARKKVAVAIARKLTVLLHRIWITGERYQPFYHTAKLKEATV